jgi:hypothetical protein
MKKLIVLAVGAMLGIVSLTLCNPQDTPKKQENRPGKRRYRARDVKIRECLAPSDWFMLPTKPYDFDRTPEPAVDCDFYHFAWQTFLYLTQPVGGGDNRARFLSFETPAHLFNIPGVFGEPESTRKLTLTPRVLKPQQANSLDSIEQAISKGVLIDRNGHPLFYGLHVNDAFAQFIRTNGYTDLDKLAAAPADQEFKIGCIELKSSWRIVEAGEDASKFYTTTALVPKLALKDGKIILDNAHPVDKNVALVGLHVVGRVKGHPEFVWATFEHMDNAPDLPTGATGDTKVTTDDWTFCPKDTLKRFCNLNPVSSSTNPLRLIDGDRLILAPTTPVYREFPFGGDDPRAIVSLTTSVHEQLPDSLGVWRNYELIGATWLDKPTGTDRPDPFKEGVPFTREQEAGATFLSNTTMETYTQIAFNCFDCHDTRAVDPPQIPTGGAVPTAPFPAKRLNVSHIITNAYFQGKQAKAKR